MKASDLPAEMWNKVKRLNSNLIPEELISLGGCQLTSLEGCPEVVDCVFTATNNFLTSLKGAPSIVHGDFDVAFNTNLTSLVGGPREVYGDYNIGSSGISCLDGIPERIIGGLAMSDCRQLTSLRGINKLKEMDGSVYLHWCPIASHILGVFFIKGCSGIYAHTTNANFQKAIDIVNTHISKGRAGLLPCQKELIEAGLADFAQI
jgi:hypothetical protein